jgi:hypothetical protein
MSMKAQTQGLRYLYRDKWPGGESTVATKLYQEELERVLSSDDPTRRW